MAWPRRLPGKGYDRVAMRMGKYNEKLHPGRVLRMALQGMTDQEICRNFGITASTLRNWMKRWPKFREALQEGRAEADSRVAEALYRRAVGGLKVPAVKPFLTKDGNIVYAEYDETLPPDVAAARHWLAQRDPERWREKKEVEITGTLEHRIEQMTLDEKKARLAELLAMASRALEAPTIDGLATEIDDDVGYDGGTEQRRLPKP